VSSDAFYQGSIGLAMGMCVLTGQAPQPQQWAKPQRDFYLRVLTITKENAARFTNEPAVEDYAEQWRCDKLWSRATGPAF
jgi:ribose transport system substrate-binding protein